MTTPARLAQMRADVADVLKRSTLRAKVLAVIDAALKDTPPPAPPPAPAVSPLYGRVNQHRASIGASSLVRDAVAERSAQGWAATMARTGEFAHNPNLRGEVGDPWFTYGENIAWTEGTSSTESVVHRMWLDSPPHRQNIEEPRFTALGIGRAVAPGGRMYWVQVFVDRTP